MCPYSCSLRQSTVKERAAARAEPEGVRLLASVGRRSQHVGELPHDSPRKAFIARFSRAPRLRERERGSKAVVWNLASAARRPVFTRVEQ